MRSEPGLKLCLSFVVGMYAAQSCLSAIEPADVLIFSKEPFQLRPRISISESYNDNLFSQSESETDLISTISPGVHLQLGKSVHNNLSLDYGYNRHFYLDRNDLNSGEHSFGLTTRLLGKRLILTGSDNVQLLSSPIGLVSFVTARPEPTQPEPGAEGGGDPAVPDPAVPDPGPVGEGETITAVGARSVERRTFSDSYNLGYGISERTGVYLSGSHSKTDYEQGVVLYDINTLRLTGGFGYRAFPRTALFGEVFYGQTATTPNFEAPKPPHVEFLGGFVGARGSFTGKLSGSARIGFESREFSDGSEVPSKPVANLALSHRVTDRSNLSLNFTRSSDVSVQFTRESYTANVVGLRWNQVLGASGKWRSSVGGDYGLLEYEAVNSSRIRDYSRHSANFSLAYQIQMWLSASLGYSYTSIQTSSGGITEYDVNQISFGVSLGY